MTPISLSRPSFFERLIFIVRVSGESGWPVLVPGKRYLASGLSVPRAGDWAVFCDPRYRQRTLIKRVSRVVDSGYIMEGMVSWASGSRDFGLVPYEYIIGKVFV